MVHDVNDFSDSEFEKSTWEIINSYYYQSHPKSIIRHQVESFNDFASKKIIQIIEGFNDVNVYHKYINELEDFKYNIRIKFCNPQLTRPMIHEKDGSTRIMTPNDARQRNFSYSANMYVQMMITSKWYDDANVLHECQKNMTNISLGKIPIMVGSNYCILENSHFQINSKECMYDKGGYFIVNGNEKVIISHDRIAENKTYVFLDTKLSQYSHIAEIRSVPDNVFSPPKLTSMKLSSKQTQFGYFIRVNIHHIRVDIPLMIIFRALGVESDKDIMRFCVFDIEDPCNGVLLENLKGSVEDGNNVLTREMALEYMNKFLNISGYPKEIMQNKSKRFNIILDILRNDFLPHVGTDFQKKAQYVGYMVNKLLRCFLGIIDMDDRDSYLNKRVDTPGVMLANLFRQYYGRVVKDVKNMIYKEINNGSWRVSNDLSNLINKSNIYKIVKPSTIESGLKYGLATGNWGIKNANSKQGVAQVLNRLTYNSTISHQRRVNTPMEKSGKLIQPRKLHNTQWGIICPSETPEGSSVGLVKNIAITASITTACDSEHIYSYVNELGVEPMRFSNLREFNAHTWVFINGNIAGFTDNANRVYTSLRAKRRTGEIHVHTSISWDMAKRQISISCEAGRCIRPLYIVDEGNTLRLTKRIVTDVMNGDVHWNNLIAEVGSSDSSYKSVIELVDVEESNTLMIAPTYMSLRKGQKGERLPLRYTHLEIHPSLILGVLASNIPFSNHNQAPRNTYQAAMGKQAIGIYTTSYKHRLDTLSHVLNYPQKPLVSTNMSKHLNLSTMPCGTNVIVAIATYTGYNQEDSIILNKSSVDRGMFTTTYYRTLKEQCNKNLSSGEEEVFCNPMEDAPEMDAYRPSNYDKIDTSGFVPENQFVRSGDVIIGKCMPQKINQSFVSKDNSITMKNNEIGYIDMSCANNKYFKNVSADGYNFCKIKIRNFRDPTIGDKLSSSHAQKGSIGIMYKQEDMPFTEDGLVPDIIINPHAIPSRMTIAQLIETIMGKACASMGCNGNATPFTSLSVTDIADVLLDKCGLEPHGNEILYNSRTGEQMRTSIFIGPTYYQRLKHMVCDKIHSRNSNGPVVLLTRQPAEGRARDGGLRLGEMEVECNWGHGTVNFLKERFMECSDNYRIHICKKCGNTANVNPVCNIYQCNTCENKVSFSEIRIPFASKLLFQEIKSMGINTRFIT